MEKTMPEKILVVEDDISLRETLAYNLEKQGYAVETAGDGKQGLQLARLIQPDLILLDVMLPGMDGFDVCRILRQEMDIPILMLTARTDEIDRVVGLELGADDYVTKPFSMRELIARVKTRLRVLNLMREKYATEPGKANRLVFDNLEINLDRHEVNLDGHPIALKPKEYELLVCLAQNTRRVMTRDQLLESVWGWHYIGESRTVDVHISWLREKIEKDPSHPIRIITVRGSGYRFDG
jgi:DNA-binding response OmpR family regulator